MFKMVKYVIQKGFISRGAHTSYEADLEFDTLEEARKEFEFLKTQPLLDNEYLSLEMQEWRYDDVLETYELDYYKKEEE